MLGVQEERLHAGDRLDGLLDEELEDLRVPLRLVELMISTPCALGSP